MQRATACFHLGVLLTDAGRVEEGEARLAEAVRLFDPRGLPLEHAKARNAHGAALRLLGHPDDAAEAFAAAVTGFAERSAAAEEGAAQFNLGLVRRDLGQPEQAIACFRRARALFAAHGGPAQEGAAARELGATALAEGDLPLACSTLAEAAELAAGAGDAAGRGAAANALGLAHLAAGRSAAALRALREALGAHPRSLRAEGYAMVQANLALAYEALDRLPRARLAARQALAIAGAAAPVREQAGAVLARLGDEPGDLARVLDEEQAEAWPAIVREEVARWAGLGAGGRRAEARAWIDGQLARPDAGAELAVAWVTVLLELPPEELELIVTTTLEALAERDGGEQEVFRSEVSRAAARFHVPQLVRLTETFNRAAERLGQEPSWG